MSKVRELLLNSTLLIASIILCLVVAEAGLRFFPVISGLNALPVSKDSPVLRFSPNRDFVYSRDWYFDMINSGHVNNDGWVNNQDYRVRDYPPLVAVIGDSQVEAQMMPYAQTFHGLLATLYDGKIRFYSFGAAGAPLSQYLVWAQYAVNRFKARALVINVVGNDFDESRIEYKSSPGFWYYAPGADGELHLQLVEFHPGAMTALVRRSALLRYLAVNLGVAYKLDAIMNWFQRHDKNNDGSPRYAGFTLANPSPQRVADSKAAVDAFLRDLSQIGLPAQCLAFTVDGFRYPDRVERDAGTFFDILRRYFLEQASARGFEAIDLDPLFLARYQKTGERFDFFPNDNSHFNANGHRLIADALQSSRLLNSGCQLDSEESRQHLDHPR
jgi:hypothetical protein